MVYLHDVTKRHGPIHLGRTHDHVSIEQRRNTLPDDYIELGLNTVSREDLQDEMIPMTGSAGDIIFFDTNEPVSSRCSEINFFKSRKNFNLGNKLSIESFEAILKSLNYLKVNKIDSLNQYSLRGGIVDVYSPIYSNPLRIEIFDDQIESIRYFDPESQLSIKRLDHFNISHGNLPPLDEISINST